MLIMNYSKIHQKFISNEQLVIMHARLELNLDQ